MTSESNKIGAFFSYARRDSIVDRDLVKFLTDTLEEHVHLRPRCADFYVWRDVTNIRTGDRWCSAIERALRDQKILIVMVTPAWIESGWCRREFETFEELEVPRGDFVVPILVRSIDETLLTNEGKEIWKRISLRQHKPIPALEFQGWPDSKRYEVVDTIAEHIAAMIKRIRNLDSQANLCRSSKSPPRKLFEFDSHAQNYERVDFLTESEVTLSKPLEAGERDVLLSLSFVERLYVEGRNSGARVEFGVRRAFITVETNNPKNLSKADGVSTELSENSIQYVKLHERPDALTISIDPVRGKTSLGERPLPVAHNYGNRFSKIAVASAGVRASQLKADFSISFDIEGIYIPEQGARISAKTQAKIKAILEVALTKENEGSIVGGLLQRAIPVEEQ